MNYIEETISLIDFYKSNYNLRGIVGLYSGGNDSSTLIHMFRPYLTHIAHVNTGTGIPETTEYVRGRASAYSVDYLEVSPPVPYEKIVTGNLWTVHDVSYVDRQIWPGGFPGPGSHNLFYSRLKERPLNQVRNKLIVNPREDRVIFLAGRRSQESKRRSSLQYQPIWERRGSVVWISPIRNLSKIDVNHYLRDNKVVLNEVSQLIHMSGECLCGCFAKKGELDEIGQWFPDVRKKILSLQGTVQAMSQAGLITVKSPRHLTWGWGQNTSTCEYGCNT